MGLIFSPLIFLTFTRYLQIPFPLSYPQIKSQHANLQCSDLRNLSGRSCHLSRSVSGQLATISRNKILPANFCPEAFCFCYFHWLCEQSSFCNLSVTSPTSQLIVQPIRRFTYVTAHSPTLPSLHLCHSLFSNPSVTSSMSQLILQPFFRFSYVTGSSLTSPGEPPMLSRSACGTKKVNKYIFTCRLL